MKKNVVDKIICADVIDGLEQITDNSIHLCCTSPPYNTLVRSGGYTNHDDNMPYKDYLNWLKEAFSFVYKKTVKGGRVAIIIDSVVNRQDQEREYRHCIYAHLYNIMTEIGWLFRTDIVFYKQNVSSKHATAWGSWKSASNPSIRNTREYILIFSKQDWKLESTEKSDLTTDEFTEYTLSTWFITPETKKLGGHPCPYPRELAKRIIKLYSFPGQIILDPFSGTGTTLVVAKQYNRHYIGIDNSKKYCEYARERLEREKQVDRISDFMDENKKMKKKENKIKNVYDENGDI